MVDRLAHIPLASNHVLLFALFRYVIYTHAASNFTLIGFPQFCLTADIDITRKHSSPRILVVPPFALINKRDLILGVGVRNSRRLFRGRLVSGGDGLPWYGLRGGTLGSYHPYENQHVVYPIMLFGLYKY